MNDDTFHTLFLIASIVHLACIVYLSYYIYRIDYLYEDKFKNLCKDINNISTKQYNSYLNHIKELNRLFPWKESKIKFKS